MAWLAAIARNCAIDWLRSTDRRREVLGHKAGQVADPAPTSTDKLLLEEERRDLLSSLDELADAQRAAIRTAFFDGQTYEEVALRNGTPIGTVKSRVRRGLLQLRYRLGSR